MDLYEKLSSLQEISKAQLSKILTANPNRKCIVLEPSIIRPLERVCGVKWLKGSGVEKIFKLESTCPQFADFPVFYMIYSRNETFKRVIDQIRSKVNMDDRPQNKYHIICVPNALYQFEEELEALGLIHTTVQLHPFQWLPLHLDRGVLSLELPTIYKTLYLDANYQFLASVSKVLWRLLLVVGKPRLCIYLGHLSNLVAHQLDVLVEEKGGSDLLDPDFGGLFVLDRSVDYASCLLTPGTYSGLLSEVYGVDCGLCEHKAAEAAGPDPGTETLNPTVERQEVSFALDSAQDPIYGDIKNRYFTEVTAVLSQLTKQLKTEKGQSKDMALDEIKRYVQTQLHQTRARKKFITNHLLAAESIITCLGARYETQQDVELNILRNASKAASLGYLDELTMLEEDRRVVLRLFCLVAATQTVSEGEVRHFWRRFLERFGYGCAYGLANLASAGFVRAQGAEAARAKLPKFGAKEFYACAARWRQIPASPEKVELRYPTCASYVFGGSFIPLINQVCSLLLNATPLEEVRSKLESLGRVAIKNERGYPLQSRTILVFVIGGVTYAEVAACNLLETLTGSRVVLLSDRIISGNDLMGDILG